MSPKASQLHETKDSTASPLAPSAARVRDLRGVPRADPSPVSPSSASPRGVGFGDFTAHTFDVLALPPQTSRERKNRGAKTLDPLETNRPLPLPFPDHRKRAMLLTSLPSKKTNTKEGSAVQTLDAVTLYTPVSLARIPRHDHPAPGKMRMHSGCAGNCRGTVRNQSPQPSSNKENEVTKCLLRLDDLRLHPNSSTEVLQVELQKQTQKAARQLWIAPVFTTITVVSFAHGGRG